MALQSQWQRTHQILCRERSCYRANSLLIHMYCSPWKQLHVEIWLPWEVVESPLLETVKVQFDRVLENVFRRRSDQVISRIPFQHLFHTVFYFCYRVEVNFLRYPHICINLLEANIIEEAGLKLTRRDTLNPHSCLLHNPAACYILTPCTPVLLMFSLKNIFLRNHLGKEKAHNKYAHVECLSNKNIFCPI